MYKILGILWYANTGVRAHTCTGVMFVRVLNGSLEKPGARRRHGRLLSPALKQPEDNPITVARRPPPPYWWIVYIIESRLYVCRRHTHTSTRTHSTYTRYTYTYTYKHNQMHTRYMYTHAHSMTTPPTPPPDFFFTPFFFLHESRQQDIYCVSESGSPKFDKPIEIEGSHCTLFH